MSRNKEDDDREVDKRATEKILAFEDKMDEIKNRIADEENLPEMDFIGHDRELEDENEDKDYDFDFPCLAPAAPDTCPCAQCDPEPEIEEDREIDTEAQYQEELAIAREREEREEEERIAHEVREEDALNLLGDHLIGIRAKYA